MQVRMFYTKKDKLMLFFMFLILALFCLFVLVPLVYVIIASFIDPVVLTNQGISFNPADWTAAGYRRVFQDAMLPKGFLNSFIYSTSFAAFSTIVCLLAAYPLSIPQFVGRRFFNTFFTITMFFGGGLIPTYLLISSLGLLDSMWAVILPGAFSVWNMIIARTYYQGIPGELKEAASVDGANEVLFFFQILLPVCTPLIAVLALWQFV